LESCGRDLKTAIQPILRVIFSRGNSNKQGMSSSENNPDNRPGEVGWFTTTQWSLVRKAGNSANSNTTEALEALCKVYWYPVYAFVRRKGYDRDTSKDLTQGFFARILEKEFVKSADPAKGKFRSFLLGALTHFLTDERNRAQRQKRGGGRVVLSLDETAETRYQLEPSHELTPEKLYERQWALTLLDQALAHLREECDAEGKTDLFETLGGILSGDGESFSHKTAATQLRMKEGAVRAALHRLRRRYAALLRNEIAQTVSGSEEVEEEIGHLFNAVSLSSN